MVSILNKDVECNECPAGTSSVCRALELPVNFTLKEDFVFTKKDNPVITLKKDIQFTGIGLIFNTQVFCLKLKVNTSDCSIIVRKIPLSIVREVNLT